MFLAKVEFALAVTYAFQLGIAASSPAQATTAVEFEVASVKRTEPSLPSDIRILPGRFEARSFRLDLLIARAYGVPRWKLIDVPDWTMTERIDIQATMPPSSSAGRAYAMLRTLLERRFRLAVEAETRDVDTDVLVFADPKGRLGPGMHPVSVDCESNRLREGSGKGLFPENSRMPCRQSRNRVALGRTDVRSVTYSAVTMDDLADALSGFPRPVLNRTGLRGQFDIALTYLSDSQLPARDVRDQPAVASRTTALEEQLGLTLRRERNRVEFLRVRSVEPLRPEDH
ncbi:MAG: TIGR03435 family protein [Vicinamibacterales bacterium]